MKYLISLFVLLSLAVGAELVATKPPYCPVVVKALKVNNLNQVNVDVSVGLSCPLDGRAYIRFVTVGGGIIPIGGSRMLRGSYPRHIGFWLQRGGRVQQLVDGHWRDVSRVAE